MTDFNDVVTGKFFVTSDIHGEIPKFGYYRDEDNNHAFSKDGVRVGGFPLTLPDTAYTSSLRMGSLNLLDFILEGETYVNAAFVRAQTALYLRGLRGLYCPGDRVYRLDPALPEIQIVLDDMHVWGMNTPIFTNSVSTKGFFQVLYAHNVLFEGIHIELPEGMARPDMNLTNPPYAGSKYNGRRAGIYWLDSDGFKADGVSGYNLCSLFTGTGYHLSAELDAWKALSPAARIVTPMDLTNVLVADDPDLPQNQRRAGGLIKLENIDVNHCDFGILAHSMQDYILDRWTGYDTTTTDAHPHLIYIPSSVTFDIVATSPTYNQKVSDRSCGRGVVTNIWDELNPIEASGKFRVHDNLVIRGWTALNTGIGLGIINCDGASIEGLVCRNLGAVTALDDPDDDEPLDESNGYGVRTSGCRNTVIRDCEFWAKGGATKVKSIWHRDVRGKQQRRSTNFTETGTILSGAYDNTVDMPHSGEITLQMSAPGDWVVGYSAGFTVLTGTGAYASFQTNYCTIIAVNGTTVIAKTKAGLGAATITGGTMVSGDLILSEGNRYDRITIYTNYDDEDVNGDFDPTTTTIADLPDTQALFQTGDSHGPGGDSAAFENCRHVDVWGKYPEPMFYLRTGARHRINNPRRSGGTLLVSIHEESPGDHTILINPDLIASYEVNDDGVIKSRVIDQWARDVEAAWFGAVINDSTVDSAPAIRTAIALAAERGLSAFKLPAGTYYIKTGEITITTDGLQFICPDGVATLVQETWGYYGLGVFASDCLIKNIRCENRQLKTEISNSNHTLNFYGEYPQSRCSAFVNAGSRNEFKNISDTGFFTGYRLLGGDMRIYEAATYGGSMTLTSLKLNDNRAAVDADTYVGKLVKIFATTNEMDEAIEITSYDTGTNTIGFANIGLLPTGSVYYLLLGGLSDENVLDGHHTDNVDFGIACQFQDRVYFRGDLIGTNIIESQEAAPHHLYIRGSNSGVLPMLRPAALEVYIDANLECRDSYGIVKTFAITSGTYNTADPGDPLSPVVLTMTLPKTYVFTGDTVTLSGLTGTGAYASLNGTWVVEADSSTTITVSVTPGLGAATITGGTLTWTSKHVVAHKVFDFEKLIWNGSIKANGCFGGVYISYGQYAKITTKLTDEADTLGNNPPFSLQIEDVVEVDDAGSNLRMSADFEQASAGAHPNVATVRGLDTRTMEKVRLRRISGKFDGTVTSASYGVLVFPPDAGTRTLGYLQVDSVDLDVENSQALQLIRAYATDKILIGPDIRVRGASSVGATVEATTTEMLLDYDSRDTGGLITVTDNATPVSATANVRVRNRATEGTRNLISNAQFDLWAAGTSFPLVADTVVTIADNWKAWRNTHAAATISQQAGFAGTTYSVQMQRTVGSVTTGSMFIVYQFASSLIRQLAGGEVTLIFSALKGANFSAAELRTSFYTGTGIDEVMTSTGFPTGGAVTSNKNIVLNTTGREYSMQHLLGSSVTEAALRIEFKPVGTAGAADYCRVSPVAVVAGATARSFKSFV